MRRSRRPPNVGKTILEELPPDRRRTVSRLMAAGPDLVPPILVQLVVLVYSIPGLIEGLPTDLKVIEFFAGLGALSLGMHHKGYRTFSYEKINVQGTPREATQDHMLNTKHNISTRLH